jgi:hypothetical protein
VEDGTSETAEGWPASLRAWHGLFSFSFIFHRTAAHPTETMPWVTPALIDMA